MTRLNTAAATMERVWTLAKKAEEALEQINGDARHDQPMRARAAHLAARIEMTSDASTENTHRRDFSRIRHLAETANALLDELPEPVNADEHALHFIATRAMAGILAYAEQGARGIHGLPAEIGE